MGAARRPQRKIGLCAIRTQATEFRISLDCHLRGGRVAESVA
jgi:hypothetical protein